MNQLRKESQGPLPDKQRELLDRVHAEHETLRRMLDSLVTRIRDVAEGSGGGAEGALARSEAQWLLTELEERLPRHFESEERAGFISRAVDEAPRLSRRADDLRAECAELSQGLASLGARMRRAGPVAKRWQELDVECRRFAQAFREHEFRENALIHEAWVEDIGAVD